MTKSSFFLKAVSAIWICFALSACSHRITVDDKQSTFEEVIESNIAVTEYEMPRVALDKTCFSNYSPVILEQIDFGNSYAYCGHIVDFNNKLYGFYE